MTNLIIKEVRDEKEIFSHFKVLSLGFRKKSEI